MKNNQIAYFTMEIAIDPNIRTYSGGLGVLAGDTVRSAADLEIPMIAVSLIHRKGYFKQELDLQGIQIEKPDDWNISDCMERFPQTILVHLEGRPVKIGVWKYEVTGITGFKVPVYFLDSEHKDNSEYDRSLTSCLYGGDHYYRFCQEVILGIGGVRILRALGYTKISKFHMNEGHSSLLTLELLEESRKQFNKDSIDYKDVENVKKHCVFTTHTPVPAGHDQFPLDLVNKVLGNKETSFCLGEAFCFREKLNLTYLALNLSHYVNGVAEKHGEISSSLFAPYKINSITNGVHLATWVSDEFVKVFDKYSPGWKHDNFILRHISPMLKEEILNAHISAKIKLIKYLNENYNADLKSDVFTIGFARRFTKYKRGDLLFYDVERLKDIVQKVGPIQIVFSGKAHPNDQPGKEIIKNIFHKAQILKDYIKTVFIPNYEMQIAKSIISGVDIWLNTPEPPLEASGTSGMKAAVNGVPSISILDGWWLEGHIEGVTGWSIGETIDRNSDTSKQLSDDAESLYKKLENIVLPMFYKERDKYIEVMINSIAINGSFFNTQRMLNEYVLNAYKDE